MAAASSKEYLKRYLSKADNDNPWDPRNKRAGEAAGASGAEKKKKKKSKKEVGGAGLRIIDDDATWEPPPARNDEDEIGAGSFVLFVYSVRSFPR